MNSMSFDPGGAADSVNSSPWHETQAKATGERSLLSASQKCVNEVHQDLCTKQAADGMPVPQLQYPDDHVAQQYLPQNIKIVDEHSQKQSEVTQHAREGEARVSQRREFADTSVGSGSYTDGKNRPRSDTHGSGIATNRKSHRQRRDSRATKSSKRHPGFQTDYAAGGTREP